MSLEDTLLSLSLNLDPGDKKIWETFGAKLAGAGLLEPRLLHTLIGDGPTELLKTCFEDELDFSDSIVNCVKELFGIVERGAAWRKRGESNGLHPQLDDVLTVLEREPKRVRYEQGRGPNDGDRQGKRR